MSNFARYHRELQAAVQGSAGLKWGFIHSSKFWSENVTKFEADNYQALKDLTKLLIQSADPTTLAVACHDVGEFVTLHPLGKKKVAELKIKDRLMDLMGQDRDDPKNVDKWREVR